MSNDPCAAKRARYRRLRNRYLYWRDKRNRSRRRSLMLRFLRGPLRQSRAKLARCEKTHSDPTGFGIDYAFTPHPSIIAMKKAGVKFVCRYLSNVDPRSKSATKTLGVSEARKLKRAGLRIVLVFETTAARAGHGRAAGVADARTAKRHARILGAPEHTVLYFAIDYDAAGHDVEAYFRGVSAVLPDSRVGAYGGIRPLAYLLDRKLITHAWQTLAWSGGQWERRASLRQYAIERRLAGADVDYNKATASGYGAW